MQRWEWLAGNIESQIKEAKAAVYTDAIAECRPFLTGRTDLISQANGLGLRSVILRLEYKRDLLA